jgi:DNA repair ATPase RecN
MLTALSVRNFQSLHTVDVELAPLTVIVGQSSSGKSALVRALHALSHNRRGTEWITHGEQAASITAQTTRHSVTLTRTQKPGDGNAYVVAPLDGSEPAARFTKLGASVPEAVTAALGIIPDGLTFARQHDMPFMLDDSAQSNANALGRLTNVHTIFQAAREANRQRTGHSSTLKTRATDLERIAAQSTRYAALPGQQSAIARAEEELSRAYRAARALQALTHGLDTLRMVSQAIPALEQQSAQPVPSLDRAERASISLQAFTTALADLQSAHTAHVTAAQHVEAASTALEQAQTARTSTLERLSGALEDAMRATEHGPDIPIPVAARVSAEYIRDVL